MITLFLILMIGSAMFSGYSFAQARKHKQIARLFRKWGDELKAGTLSRENAKIKLEVIDELKDFGV